MLVCNGIKRLTERSIYILLSVDQLSSWHKRYQRQGVALAGISSTLRQKSASQQMDILVYTVGYKSNSRQAAGLQGKTFLSTTIGDQCVSEMTSFLLYSISAVVNSVNS